LTIWHEFCPDGQKSNKLKNFNSAAIVAVMRQRATAHTIAGKKEFEIRKFGAGNKLPSRQ